MLCLHYYEKKGKGKFCNLMYVYKIELQLERYEKEMEVMEAVSRDEYLASLRRRSSGFSRGVSKYRGVARYL